MANKNVGITLLGVVVAIGAFVAGNIWSTNLHGKVDRLTYATEAWNSAYNAVKDKEIDLKGNVPTDVAVATARLKHRIENAHQLEDATLKLIQVGTGNLADDEASITITEHLHRIEQQSGSVDSADRAAALDKETLGLLDQLTGRGVLRNSDALKMKEQDESKEKYVKYAGYSLSILGIIIAAVAQLTRKST